jgi:hypothetical protein
MTTLDVTFTLALPVSVAQLGAHLQAYLDMLPAVNALRACNHFGKGPQCHINKLPVEIVDSITHYYTLPVREEKLKQWKGLLNCYEDKCAQLDHYTRDELLKKFHEFMSEGHFEEYPSEPNDAELEEFAADAELMPDDAHQRRRNEWVSKLEKLHLEDRPVFLKHFGLDIWLSRVCLGTSWREDSANTTVAYLILPDRVSHTKEWDRHMTEDGYIEPDYESGYGMAVSLDQREAPDDVQNFKRVMKSLDLKVFLHSTQSQGKALSLASSKRNHTPALVNNAASFPRPMFLVRNKVEGE